MARPLRPITVGRSWPAWALLIALLGSCSGARPTALGVDQGRFAPCPPSPNCVSSDAPGEHAVEPFRLKADPAHGWRAARDAVAALPRTRIVSETADYLHAECESALFRFVDDLELHLRPGVIAVRSASRVGYSDLGVNRRRIEALRESLEKEGVIQ